MVSNCSELSSFDCISSPIAKVEDVLVILRSLKLVSKISADVLNASAGVRLPFVHISRIKLSNSEDLFV
jgi:hypothetical protein